MNMIQIKSYSSLHRQILWGSLEKLENEEEIDAFLAIVVGDVAALVTERWEKREDRPEGWQ